MVDYYCLEEVYEVGDKDEIECCCKLFLVSVKCFVKDIRNKYLVLFWIINFGVLFVLIEGFYLEIVCNLVFFDDLRWEE